MVQRVSTLSSTPDTLGIETESSSPYVETKSVVVTVKGLVTTRTDVFCPRRVECVCVVTCCQTDPVFLRRWTRGLVCLGTSMTTTGRQ